LQSIRPKGNTLLFSTDARCNAGVAQLLRDRVTYVMSLETRESFRDPYLFSHQRFILSVTSSELSCSFRSCDYSEKGTEDFRFAFRRLSFIHAATSSAALSNTAKCLSTSTKYNGIKVLKV